MTAQPLLDFHSTPSAFDVFTVNDPLTYTATYNRFGGPHADIVDAINSLSYLLTTQFILTKLL